MDNNIQEKFDAYIEAYTKLNTEDKKNEYIKKLKSVISNLMMLNQSLGFDYDLLINRELLDLKDIPVTEDDFLEGAFVYIHTIDELINTLVFNLINKND